MFLAEPQRTPYDWRFQILGFPVRVSPFFWLAALVLGHGWSGYADDVFRYGLAVPEQIADDNPEYAAAVRSSLAESNPGQGVLLLIWTASMFVSILIHELGHTLAFRRYGTHASIVLYHFGGLAIPESSSFRGYSPRGGGNDSTRQIVISAAGPGAQLLLALAVVLMMKAGGYGVSTGLPFLDNAFLLEEGRIVSSAPLSALVQAIMFPSVYWALLNLVPVFPLDGGQISRAVFTLLDGRDGLRNSLMLSMIAGGAVGAFGFHVGQPMLALMFLMLAFSSYQLLSQISGRGGGFGPW